MEQYAEVVQDLAGNAVPGASVQVLVGSVNGVLATIYDAAGTIRQNPITTGPLGEFAFQAANGKYALRVLVNGNEYRTVGPLSFYDPADDAGRTVSLLDFLSAEQRMDAYLRLGTLDMSDAIQAAIVSNTELYAPPGVYSYSRPLIGVEKFKLKGSKRGTVFKALPTFAAGNLTRTYVDAAGATKTLIWNDKAMFYLPCPNNSYLIDFQVEGVTFDLPADGSVGVFNAQRMAHSGFRDIFCNTSSYFVKGFDIWMTEWTNIRTRFSKSHFTIDTGTSNTFSRVHCDQKHSSGGNGYSFTNLTYSTMLNCGADFVDRAIYLNNCDGFELNGCGVESASRMFQIVFTDAAKKAAVTITGGKYAVYKAASATGTFVPYAVDGPGEVTITGAWLGIANPATAGGTYDKMAITNGAQVTTVNCRAPVEIDANKWWYVADANSALCIIEPGTGVRYVNRLGVNRRGAASAYKTLEYRKTITAGSAQTLVRIDNAPYGAACYGKITLDFFNSYSPDIGFFGRQEYLFSCTKETTATQVLNKTGDALTVSNSGGATLGAITAVFVRNADNTVDMQLTVPAAFGSTVVDIVAEYTSYIGGNASGEVMTGQ